MKLIVMTRPSFFVEEDSIITSLFDEGLDCLHLCKPNSTPIYAERLLSLIADEYYGKIVVHDHFYLKEEYRLRGIHIDGNDEPPTGYKGNVSRTCHSIDELKEAKKKSAYVFMQGALDTADGRCLSAQAIADARRSGLIDKKVFVAGNVGMETIRMAKEMGFGGVVVCEDLWNRFDIHNELDYKQLIAHFVNLRKAAD